MNSLNMYSGSDSTESANYGQWPLNPAFFQNMPNEQVDWAALAQQWIQMKEAGPPIPEPKKIEKRKEKNDSNENKSIPPLNSDENLGNSSWNNISGPSESLDNTWNWKTQQAWDWNSSWNPQLNASPVVNAPPKTTLLPTPQGYSSAETTKDASSKSGYTSKNNDFSGGFGGTNHSRHYKPHNRRYSKVNIPKPVTPKSPVNIPTTSDLDSSSLDASKRKQLPAWIREGLEKMERDKQKQIEREKEKEKHSLYTEKVKEQEKETMEILKDTIKERRSKFDSDEELSPKRTEHVKTEPEPLSHEDLMLLVRRKMTEILLKVTNEAIHSICTEERERYLKKIQTYGKSYGKGNVSAKLGLGMYGSDSGSETENSESSRKDSDDELRNTIKRRKAEFVHIEKEIEKKLLQSEQTKENKRGNEENDGDDGEDEYSSGNRTEDNNSPEIKRTDEINSRSKSYSNTKQHRSPSVSSEESDKVSSHKKSSSRSRESSLSTRKKHRSRSRDRGYTPEKRKRLKSPKRSRSRSYERRYSSDYKYKKEISRSGRSRRSRSRSRTFRKSRSRSSSYRSRRSSETSSRSRRKHSRSPYHSRSTRRSRSRSRNKSSRAR